MAPYSILRDSGDRQVCLHVNGRSRTNQGVAHSDAVLGELPDVVLGAAVPQSDGVSPGSEWVGPKHHRGTAMENYAGIDVSLEQSSVCVVDAKGQIVREVKVASEPEALVRFFRRVGVSVTRIGLQAGPLSQWLHAALTEAGFDAVLLETRHV